MPAVGTRFVGDPVAAVWVRAKRRIDGNLKYLQRSNQCSDCVTLDVV